MKITLWTAFCLMIGIGCAIVAIGGVVKGAFCSGWIVATCGWLFAAVSEHTANRKL